MTNDNFPTLKRNPSVRSHPNYTFEQIDEIEAQLLRCNDVDLLVTVFLAVESGLRVREIVRLTLADVNLATKTVRVVGKSHDRMTLLGPKSEKYIQQSLKRRDASLNSPLLLPSITGKPLQTAVLRNRFSLTVPEMAYVSRFSVHRLRHTFATRLFAGAPTSLEGWTPPSGA